MKLKNAPNMKKQRPNAQSVRIIAGVQAWDFANIPPPPRSAAEIELEKVLPSEPEGAPIVLDLNALAEIDRLRIAPQKVQVVTVQRANNAEELENSVITAICLNLAQHTEAQQVRYIDEAEQEIADWSAHIYRLRTNAEDRAFSRTFIKMRNGKTELEAGEEIEQEDAQEARREAIKAGAQPNAPYIEKRTENGIKGLYRITPKYDQSTGEVSEKIDWLCDVVQVVGIGRSESEDFIILQFQQEGEAVARPIVEALPLSDLGEREGWKQLKGRGLKITTQTSLRNALADYLQLSGDRKLWRVTGVTGWQNGAYLLPNGEIIGEATPPTVFKSHSATAKGYTLRGTAQEWRENVARLAVGNPSMMLGIAAAFSAPMVGLLGAENFGLHLFEDSSRGKTTTANIANSIYGDPEQIGLTWNLTHVGITNEAAARNDNFLTIDEIGQGKAKEAEQVAYTLFNGISKIKGRKDGGNVELMRWKITALSFGEKDLETHLNEKGIKINAGQLVRLLNVPFEAATQWHEHATAKDHADQINRAARSYFGAVGREWIKYLIEAQADGVLLAEYEAIKTKWQARPPADADPQVFRAVGRFALLETALQLARPFTGWSEQENAEAVLHCFTQWISVFGLHSKKEQQIIEQVNGWLLANAEGRFIAYPFDVQQGRISNIAGYRMTLTDQNNREHFYLYPQAFEEAIKGNEKTQACRILADNGMLRRSNETRYNYLIRLPHKVDPKRSRCYMLFPIDESKDEEQET